MLKRVGFWGWFFFYGAAVWANAENRNLIPLGEVECFTANAGVAGGDSTGAVFFNPARLVLIHHPRLSVSGNVYAYMKASTDSLAHVDNTDLPYSASGFQAVPGTVSSAFKMGDWSAAFSILIPDMNGIENQKLLPTPNTGTTLIQLQSSQDLWIGPSLARSLGDGWSVGMSLFAIRHTDSSALEVITRFPSSPNQSVVNAIHLSNAIYGLTATLGALYQANAWLDLGLRVQLPILNVLGSGTGYAFSQTYDGAGNPTVVEKSENETHPHYQLPWDFSLGARWHLISGLRLLTDVSLQVATSYDSAPGSAFATNVRYRTVPRLNLGIEGEFTPELAFGAGFLYDPSAFPDLSAEVTTRQDAYGLTGGVTFISGRVRTGLGLFYLWSSGQNIPGGNPGARAKISGQNFGAILNFAYLLGDMPNEGR
jgi:hypothetical protein